MINTIRFLALAFVLLNFLHGVTTSRFDMDAPLTGTQDTRYNFKYTGLLNTGNKLAPVTGQLSKDAKNLYFVSQNADGKKEVYKMSRVHEGDNFSEAVKLEGEINSGNYNITMLSLSADEKTMIFVGSISGKMTDEHLFTATKDANGKFNAVRRLDEINDTDVSESYPWLSPNGLTVYFSRRKGENVVFWAADRKSVTEKFGHIHEFNFAVPNTSNNLSCALNNSETDIFSLSGDVIYHASRKSVNDKFGPAEAVAQAANEGFINCITISNDTRELYVFNSVGPHNSQILRFYNSGADEVHHNPGK